VKHLIQDVECPACTILAGPCATAEPSRVAWPVFVLQGPASMSKLVKVARALKVLHGDGLTHKLHGEWHAWYTPGKECDCVACSNHLFSLVKGPHGAGH
jgi:hypothetical protein